MTDPTHQLNYATERGDRDEPRKKRGTTLIVVLTLCQGAWLLPGAWSALIINCSNDGAALPLLGSSMIVSAFSLLAIGAGVASWKRMSRGPRAVAASILALHVAFVVYLVGTNVYTITHRSPNDIWCP